MLSYGNTIRGQHLALYARTGQLLWTYHLKEPASESSKGILVPDAPLAIAGIERDGQYYLQGFSLKGELLWVAPVPEPIDRCESSTPLTAQLVAIPTLSQASIASSGRDPLGRAPGSQAFARRT